MSLNQRPDKQLLPYEYEMYQYVISRILADKFKLFASF